MVFLFYREILQDSDITFHNKIKPSSAAGKSLDWKTLQGGENINKPIKYEFAESHITLETFLSRVL